MSRRFAVKMGRKDEINVDLGSCATCSGQIAPFTDAVRKDRRGKTNPRGRRAVFAARCDCGKGIVEVKF